MADFGLEAVADGAVRKCQPFHRDNTCPSCDTNRGKVFGFIKRPHKVGVSDGQFVTRECRNCHTVWRERVEEK
jgi:RNA polymerase subunit RPABC4/transcription elongation factor Spt4